jgi:hypothetical protein
VLPTPLFTRVMAERNLHIEADHSGNPS